jgi:hypothetical protein
MFAAMGLAAALFGADAVWPRQPVAQSPRPTEAPSSAQPVSITFVEPVGEGGGPWTKYQVPPPPITPGLSTTPPGQSSSRWTITPAPRPGADSPEDAHAEFRGTPPRPPEVRALSEYSDAELLEALLGPGWEGVRPDGWTLMSRSSELLTFHRPARQPRHIWFRVEYSDVASDYRSARSLNEVDCAGGRLRIVSLSTFSLPNLEGPHEGFNEIQSWDYVAPDTHGETMLKAVCGE